MENTKIEWAHHTWNPWRGCTKVSEGCKHCYAEKMSHRNPKVLGMWGPQGTRVMAAESAWKEPLKWNKEAEAAGERHRVFCASLADVFEGPETCTPEAYAVICKARVRLFELIATTPHLDWLLLTKRPENWNRAAREVLLAGHDARYVSKGMAMARGWINGIFPENVWIGTSVENQAAADKRIPELLKIPAAIRFLSCEPLLRPLKLAAWLPDRTPEPIYHERYQGYSGMEGPESPRMTYCADESPIHWVIAGGESGPHARPMHPDWVQSLRDQCQDADVPFFFKQWGEWSASGRFMGDVVIPRASNPDGGDPYHPDYLSCKVPNTPKDGSTFMFRVGKKNAGRLLDGREWNEFPEVAR